MQRTALLVSAAIFALPIAAAAATTSDSCSSVAACVLGTQSSAGIGVNGVSKSGFGVEGTTSVAATTAAKGRAGVFGKDATTSSSDTYNSGVSGLSKYGYGVYGTSTNGSGVYGTSTNGSGVYGTSQGTGGLFSGNIGVDGEGGDSGAGVYGDADFTGAEFSTYGADYPASQIVGDAIIAYGAEYSPGNSEGYLFYGISCYIDNNNSKQCDNVAGIDTAGNGSFNEGNFNSETINTKRVNGAAVTSYGARSASPTIEDFGTGTMRNGTAYVALDKTYASTISPGYMVFVTPHGDSNSLYTQPSANGFTVRESKGGHSSLTFDYRIVAKPLDAKAAHLPLAAPHNRRTQLRPLHLRPLHRIGTVAPE